MRLFSTPFIAQANRQLQHLHRASLPISSAFVPAGMRRVHLGYQALAQEALGVMGPVLDRGLGRGPVPPALLCRAVACPWPRPSPSPRSTAPASAPGTRPPAVPGPVPPAAQGAAPRYVPEATPTATPYVAHPALAPGASLFTLLDHAACAGVMAAAITGPWAGLCFGARRVLPVAGACVAIACACAVGIYLGPVGPLAEGLQVLAGLLALQTRLLVQGTAWLTAAGAPQSRER